MGFLSVPLLSFINKPAMFALKVNMDFDHKSEMEDILNKAGLSELLQRFIAEKVEPETITAAY